MKIKLLFTALLFNAFCFAQINFTENVIIDETFGSNYPAKIIAADLDGDGFEDVISLTHSVHWYKNLYGQGNFDQPILIENIGVYSSSQFDLDAADIDEDGDIDLVFFDKNPDNFSQPILVWVENLDGLGNFSENQELKLLDNLSRLKVDLLDVDNDGDIDITYSDYEKIGWMENTDGSGNFIDHILITIPSGINYDGYSFSDLNGDNRMDIVVDYQNSLDFYVHNIDNTATLIQNLDNSSSGKYVVTADVDNDSDNDVVTILLNGINSEVLWYENTNGLGLFSSRATVVSLPDMVDADIDSVNDIAFKDLDGDDLLDLLFSYEATNKMSWYKNLGLGSFGGEQVITSSQSGIKTFFATDLNNDSQIDIITSASYIQQVSWFNNLDGLGGFGEQNIISHAWYSNISFDKGDLDRDGDLDLVTVSQDGKLSLFENTDGQGNFDEGHNIIAIGLQTQGDDSIIEMNVFISDIDGDEDLDILVWVAEEDYLVEGRIHLFANDGNLNFTESIPIEFEGFRRYLAHKDIDGDNYLDLVGVLGDDYSSVFYHKNNGDGTFGNIQFVPGNYNYVRALDLGDIDMDGDLDLVIGETGGDISWFNNDGLGNYVLAQTLVGNGSIIREIGIEDITNDDQNDIFFVANNSTAPRQIGLLRNSDGLGVFNTQEILLSSSDYFGSVTFIDFDNDRDKDILTRRLGGPSTLDFVWYENLGDITGDEFSYGTSNTILEGRFPYQIELIDIDDNGSLDIVGSFDLYSLAWFENYSLEWNEIVGTVKIADGLVCDENSIAMENMMIVADNGINEYATFSSFSGVYQMHIEEPGVYTTSYSEEIPNYFQVNPASYSSDLTNLGVTEIHDFCVEPIGIVHDLDISVLAITNEPRPGFDSFYRIVYTNKGTVPESGTVSFEYDETMAQFLNASEVVDSQTNNTLVFNFQDLAVFESRTIDLAFTMFTPPIVNNNDLFQCTAIVDSGEEDVTPGDNHDDTKQIIVNSYDPNDITVMEGSEIFIEDAEDYLHYVIRFQNTGTASAININVKHQLDEKLNWATMRLLSLSHPGRVEIIDGSDVNFIFDDIHLADSTSNEPDSHGYIAYKIKPKSNVVVGDIFSAVADIYFDFNPPIITNTATTEIVEPLSVNEFNAQSIQLFPNPAKDKLEIISNTIINKLSVNDINGRQLRDIKISSLDYSLDVSGLSTGVYFLEIHSGGKKSTKKFIKN